MTGWTIEDWKEVLETFWYWYKIPFFAALILFILRIYAGHLERIRKEKRDTEMARRRSLPYDPNDISLSLPIKGQLDEYLHWIEYKGKYYGEGTVVKFRKECRLGNTENFLRNVGCAESRMARFAYRLSNNLTYFDVVAPQEDGTYKTFGKPGRPYRGRFFTGLVPEHYIEEIVYPVELTKEEAVYKHRKTMEAHADAHRNLPRILPIFCAAAVSFFGALFKMFVPVTVVCIVLLVLYYCYIYS